MATADTQDEALACQARVFKAVAQIGLRLASIRTLRQLLAESVELICDMLDFKQAVIYLLEDAPLRNSVPLKSGAQRLVAHAGRGQAGRGEWLALDEQSALGQALSRRETVCTPIPPAGDDQPAWVEVALPLMSEKTVGVMALYSERSGFSQDELAAYELLASCLAAAIYNAQTHINDARVLANAERRAKLLEATILVGRDVASSVDVVSIMDLDPLLSRIVDTICMVYDFYYAAVFLVDTKMQRWAVLRAGYGEAGKKMFESGYLLEIDDHSMVGWCIKHKQARIALDVGLDAVRFDNPYLPLTRSEMALPLIVGDEVIGALSVQSTQESAFDENDINTLQILADQLATSINNARLLSDLREANRELLRTKTFEAIAQATGETIHWVGNKAAPIPGCVSRTREDVARFVYIADALRQEAPEALRQHLFAQLIAEAAATLDEQSPAGRQLLDELQDLPLKKARRLLNMESILEDLDIIKLSAETILAIKENMIGPARETHRRRLRIDELLEKTVTSMAIPDHIHLKQNYAPDLAYVVADPRQLESVFNNLLKNAIEAMDGRPEPRLTITAAPAEMPGYVAVSITDTGCGIPKPDMDRIWMSFYTTKGDRGGTGLGLSSCLQIINQMEGKIQVESELNVGTTFSVLLPTLVEG
ncbi:MAG: GAF domain-containing protein [Thermoflexales bacterium]|nr:GAF domain-containing protein [Thermoflexales bacterium]